MDRLTAIPGILQGRYDISGPPDTVWQLHQVWRGSQLVLLDTGHGGQGFAEAFAQALGTLGRPIADRP